MKRRKMKMMMKMMIIETMITIREAAQAAVVISHQVGAHLEAGVTLLEAV